MNLKHFAGHTFDERITDDPIMVELMENGEADIFTSDDVVSVLMCSTKSNYSWDIEINKADNIIIIDKRNSKTDRNILNFQTVCENAANF
jgi:translation initiation factor 3 subunit D